MTTERMLVVGAHSADFVWRAAGAIARHTAAGGEARVVALTYGERGESGELWKQPDQTVENVKRIRHSEATTAAGELGAGFECFDLGDYPLEVDRDARDRLASLLREFAPQVVLTHPERDPFNPDHPVAHAAVARARLLSTGGVVAAAFRTVPPSRWYAFEPHQPELCGFVPTTYVDITSVYEAKVRAMAAMAAQSYLRDYYAQRAEQRGNHARKVTADASIRQAEAFQQLLPRVVDAL
jgi:4-oxalomesaconate hydratase